MRRPCVCVQWFFVIPPACFCVVGLRNSARVGFIVILPTYTQRERERAKREEQGPEKPKSHHEHEAERAPSGTLLTPGIQTEGTPHIQLTSSNRSYISITHIHISYISMPTAGAAGMILLTFHLRNLLSDCYFCVLSD